MKASAVPWRHEEWELSSKDSTSIGNAWACRGIGRALDNDDIHRMAMRLLTWNSKESHSMAHYFEAFVDEVQSPITVLKREKRNKTSKL